MVGLKSSIINHHLTLNKCNLVPTNLLDSFKLFTASLIVNKSFSFL